MRDWNVIIVCVAGCLFSQPAHTELKGDEPRVDALAPNAGSAEGFQRVLLMGTGLLDVEDVFFGDTPALGILHLSDIALQVTTPSVSAMVEPGATVIVDVSVVGSGVMTTLLQSFEFIAASAEGEGEGEGEGDPGPVCFGVRPEDPPCDTRAFTNPEHKEGIIPPTLYVTVWDEDTGAAIDNAVVEIAGPDSLSVDGSPNGLYLFSPLTPGIYSVRVTASGFQVCDEDVRVQDNSTSAVSVGMITPDGAKGYSIAALARSTGDALALGAACLGLVVIRRRRPSRM